MCSGNCIGGCTCSSNSTVLPIGPQGDTGATGAQGDPGADGADGTDGINGTFILGTTTTSTGVATPASMVETSLFLKTINANTLVTNGDEIELYAYFESIIGIAATTVTIRFKLAGLTIFTDIVATALIANNFSYKIKITKLAAGSQLWTIERYKVDVTTPATNVAFTRAVSAMDETIANTFQITGQNSVNTALLTMYKATLYKNTI